MELRDARVVIIGLGETAVALARLLLACGGRPFVSELGPGKPAQRATLDALGVPYETGGHTDRAIDDVALCVPSPGVPLDAPPLLELRARGVPILGEMEIASHYCRSRVLAVTGTNGKTTTTELLRAMIDACGKSVLLAGNNALPFSAAVMIEPAPEYIVLEVSSYQLETAVSFRPWIACVLNLTPDHLARHKTMDAYAAAKGRIFAFQRPGDAAVLNEDDPWVAPMEVPEGVQRFGFSLERPLDGGIWFDGCTYRLGAEPFAAVTDSSLPGRHNVQNVAAALAMMYAGGFPHERALAGLRAFRGVEHRIEYVANIDGVDYFNDSKSTNIDSLRVALESFTQPVVLIAGGRGKGCSYRELGPLVRTRVKAIVTLGEDASRIEDDLGSFAPATRAVDMEDAVDRARARAADGDAVLLSPACASFDMYENFEERGRHFKACVRAVAAHAHIEEGTPCNEKPPPSSLSC